MAPDTVKVVIGVKWIGPFCVPDKTSDKKVWALFRKLDCGDYWEMEQQTIISVGEGKQEVRYQDGEEIRKIMIKKLLIDWNLDIPLEFDDQTGYLTNDCFNRVKSVSAPIIAAFLVEYEKVNSIPEGEEKKVDKQAAILFSKNSNGVQNPCESLSLFCTLGNFWEKFGLNRFDLRSLPYREYMMLRMMLHKEGESNKQQMHSSRPRKPTMIAGPGGRTRPSRGVVVGE